MSKLKLCILQYSVQNGREEDRGEEDEREEVLEERKWMRAKAHRWAWGGTERLKAEAVRRENKGKELEAARKAAEEGENREQKRGEEEAQQEAKKVVSALEEEVLNTRKFIEDLQSDKRRARRLLLELGAQLMRPTHTAPSTHMNLLRLGGSSQAAIRAPVIPPICAPPPSTISQASAPRGPSPLILSTPWPQASLLHLQPYSRPHQRAEPAKVPINQLLHFRDRLSFYNPRLHPAGRSLPHRRGDCHLSSRSRGQEGRRHMRSWARKSSVREQSKNGKSEEKNRRGAEYALILHFFCWFGI